MSRTLSKLVPSKRRRTNSLPKFRLFHLLFLRLVLRYLIEVSSVNCKRIPWLGERERRDAVATAFSVETWKRRFTREDYIYIYIYTDDDPNRSSSNLFVSRGTNSRYKDCFEIFWRRWWCNLFREEERMSIGTSRKESIDEDELYYKASGFD